MIKYFDKQNCFVELFDPTNGYYARTGVLNDKGEDTGVDPFMRDFPALIDIGIMQSCVCAKRCKVDCYQKAIDRFGANMSLDDYKEIMRQSKGKVFQVALGGAGDPDTHENFGAILKITREHNIVPNFTTSGIAFYSDKARLCKDYCGAVAVSVKTNLHYVLSNKSIDDAIARLREGCFYDGINAVVFLLYKPIGLGKRENVLRPDDPKLNEFFELVDKGGYDFKIGFDSCSCPGIVNKTSNVDLQSIDFCEGARYSMYIDAHMNAMPCSFGNQDEKYFVSLRDFTIEEAWHSYVFEDFRRHLRDSCPGCANRYGCAGGCPICRDIVLCNAKEKVLV